MEVWDLLDAKRRPLQRTHARGQPLRAGAYHTVVEVWTVNRKHQILVTLRDATKDIYPDKWENTGGSALAGESSRQAAVRELGEETGITAKEHELLYLGTCQEASAFVDIFLLRRDLPISDLTMQAGETVAAQWITIEQLEQRIADQSLAVPTGKRLQQVRDRFNQLLYEDFARSCACLQKDSQPERI